METAWEMIESRKSIQTRIQTTQMSLGTIQHLNLWINRLMWVRTAIFCQNQAQQQHLKPHPSLNLPPSSLNLPPSSLFYQNPHYHELKFLFLSIRSLHICDLDFEVLYSP